MAVSKNSADSKKSNVSEEPVSGQPGTDIEVASPGTLTVAVAEKLNAALAALLEKATAQWEDEQTGFPPYWAPGFDGDTMSPGFIGRVIGIEEAKSDTDFDRWIISPTYGSVVCKKGPADDADLIEVKPGEFFTMSSYSSLQLQPYVGHEIAVIPQRKRDIGKGRDLWDWRLKVSKETKARIIEQLEKMREPQVA